MSERPSYLMESPDEADRLEAKTDSRESRRLLELAGLAPGMKALDAGAGTGAVARTMADIVGPEGSVVALDRSTDRLRRGRRSATEAGLDNLTFLLGDLEDSVPEGGPYDFVWSRFLFEYLADPDRALVHLIGATRPGGKIVVADLDGNAVFHHPFPPDVERGFARLLPALEGRFDPHAGRKLFTRFRRAGLVDIRVHVEPYHLYAGPAPEAGLANWKQKLWTIRSVGAAALGGESAFDEWASKLLALLADPDSFTYSVLVLVEGNKRD